MHIWMSNLYGCHVGCDVAMTIVVLAIVSWPTVAIDGYAVPVMVYSVCCSQSKIIQSIDHAPYIILRADVETNLVN